MTGVTFVIYQTGAGSNGGLTSISEIVANAPLPGVRIITNRSSDLSADWSEYGDVAVWPMAEGGYPDIKGDSWVGLLFPAGTPTELVNLLNHEIVAILALPDMRERLATLGNDPVASTPEEFAQQIKNEIQMWGDVIRRANIKPQ